jgi:lysophosphatidate acyltransferase
MQCRARALLFYYSMQRQDRSSAVSKLSTVEQRLKEQKNSVWVFPEGTRNKTNPGEVLPFKKGAFHMAVNAQVPIVPGTSIFLCWFCCAIDIIFFFFLNFFLYSVVVISNIWRVCDPFGDGWHWKGGDLYIKCLDPIETKGKSSADIDALIAQAHEAMARTLAEMEARADSEDKKKK